MHRNFTFSRTVSQSSRFESSEQSATELSQKVLFLHSWHDQPTSHRQLRVSATGARTNGCNVTIAYRGCE